MRYKKQLFFCLFTIIIVLILSFILKERDCAMENESVKVIIGDSRTMGLIVTLGKNEEYTKFCENVDGAVYDAIFYKDGTWLLICSQAGGYYKSGAYKRAANRAISLFNSNQFLKDCTNVSFFNLFAFNDLFLDPQNCRVAPSRYIEDDAKYAGYIRGCKNVYQFNAGPIDEEGYAEMFYGINNALLADYNSLFVGNNRVKVVDLYSYLYTQGYKGIVNEVDSTGIHYENDTNEKIIKLIECLL